MPRDFDDAFELLGAFQDGNGNRILDDVKLQVVVASLSEKMQRCENCVNPDFTAQLVPIAAEQSQFVYEFSTDMAIFSRVNSAITERWHLSGQELKPTKSRGLALDALALQTTTYRKSVTRDSEILRGNVEGDVLKRKGITQQEFAVTCSRRRLGWGASPEQKMLTCGSSVRKSWAGTSVSDYSGRRMVTSVSVEPTGVLMPGLALQSFRQKRGASVQYGRCTMPR